MIAVIASGGKQFLVKPGQKLSVEKLTAADATDVKFDTLLVADEAGAKVEIGTPKLPATTSARVERQWRTAKVIVRKYKNKTGYHRKFGHRQAQTEITVGEIA